MADDPQVTTRRQRILELVSATGFARVADLSRELSVSEVTVRSDLAALEREQAIDRVHGAAVVRGMAQRGERPFEVARESSADEKRRIGRAGAALVESGSSVLLDVGTTTAAVADALLERDDLHDVVVITNGLSIALALEPAIPRFTVVVTGGTLRPLQHSLVAPYASMLLAGIRADIAFIGCTGVDAAAGVTNLNLPETELKRAMLAASDRAVVVAESSKLGRTSLGVIGALDRFDLLITASPDAGREEHLAQLARLEAAGLDCRSA
ncbi:DeoR/GlpR family DNA-binding transcription regulator [Herbiconiux sp.]|jgi:DeoR family transcriptional regulator of aga operon|uniref:DeoR/GlpR family DNA-binding transcription regulator n=1 Tax=Herbiconiux sp. TaxID=1871186 RepID=UPI0025BF91EA|nr:DeoR/GlpR family DNA-binding transcription regulator [Herbiconiux sp.]